MRGTADRLDSVLRVWGAMSDPRSFKSTWRFESGFMLTCDGAFTEGVHFYDCVTPEGIEHSLERSY